MKTTEVLQIEGMSCTHCVHTVQNALNDLEGVHVEAVAIGSAHVVYDAAQVDRQALISAIEETGFEVGKPSPPVSMS
jgi:copper chaperone CopZ